MMGKHNVIQLQYRAYEPPAQAEDGGKTSKKREKPEKKNKKAKSKSKKKKKKKVKKERQAIKWELDESRLENKASLFPEDDVLKSYTHGKEDRPLRHITLFRLYNKRGANVDLEKLAKMRLGCTGYLLPADNALPGILTPPLPSFF